MATASPLARLPPELKQEILSALPDVWSLRSMALTCSSFYHAFINAERLITTRVLKNHVDANVLPDAIAALRSSQLKPRTWREICDFASKHLHSRASPPASWTMVDALAVSNLHSYVEYWSEKFVTEMFNTASTFAYIDAPPAGPLSQNEKNRIQRALYRFEVYQNLCRDSDVRENRGLLICKFSHCENEQLACVHDYLFRAVCPAYNDICEQTGNVFTAVDLVEYGDDFDAGPIQRLLSRGLTHLRRIVDLDFGEARHRALDSFRRPANNTLYAALKDANGADDGVYLSEYTQEEQDRLARDNSPLQDPDRGPLDAWAWAHQHQSRSDFVYSDSQIALRARGYCMWDRARLEQWHIFQKAWEAPNYPYQGDEQMSRKAEMEMWCERHPQY